MQQCPTGTVYEGRELGRLFVARKYLERGQTSSCNGKKVVRYMLSRPFDVDTFLTYRNRKKMKTYSRNTSAPPPALIDSGRRLGRGHG